MISEAFGAFAKEGAEKGFLLWRRRIVARPRRFERIAARMNHALDVAGLAAGAEQVLEAIEMGFEFVVRDAPILNGQFRIEDLLAVALLDVSFVDEVSLLKTKALGQPMRNCRAGWEGGFARRIVRADCWTIPITPARQNFPACGPPKSC